MNIHFSERDAGQVVRELSDRPSKVLLVLQVAEDGSTYALANVADFGAIDNLLDMLVQAVEAARPKTEAKS